MKQVSILIYLILIQSFFGQAQQVNFESSLELAFTKAKQENKLVFIEYYNEKCPICRSIEPYFEDKTFSDFYNQNFINYRLNTYQISKADSLFLKQTRLKFEGFPFFLFFDQNQKFIHYSGAKPDLKFLLESAKTALNPEERTGSLPSKYDNGNRSLKTLYAYSELMQLYENEDLVTKIANELFDNFPQNQLDSQKSYLILKNAVFDIDNGFFVYWANHMDKMVHFEQGTKSGSEKDMIQNKLLKAINSNNRKKWDLNKIIRAKDFVLKTQLNSNPNLYFWEQESELLVASGNTLEALNLFYERTKSQESIIAQCYVIHHFLSLFKDKKELEIVNKTVQELSKKPISVLEKSALQYEIIFFYYRINQKAKAIKEAEKAIRFDKQNGIDHKKINELVNQF